jgi:esterase/lipase
MTDKKPLVVLIHGFLGHPEEFGELIPLLQSHGYATHQVCLPEHGNEPGYIANITWHDLLSHCHTDLDRITIDYSDIHLIGFSLGGALSLVLSAQRPTDFKSLTLVAAPCKPVFNLEFGQYHIKNFFNRFLPGLPRHQWNTGFPKPMFYPHDLIRLYRQMDSLFTAVQDSAPRLALPTLLLHSAYDLTIPYEHSEWLHAAIPAETNLVTLLDCGHQVFPHKVKGTVGQSVIHHIQTVDQRYLTRLTG